MPEHTRVLIIGSGPAGLTAAIYSARAQLNPIVIEGEPSSTTDQPGGQLMLTTDVENYPGFPDGIMGPEMMQKFRDQAERFGARLITDQADRVELARGSDPAHPAVHSVWVGDTEYRARTVVLAMGAEHKKLGVAGEEELSGRGVSYCATCDAAFFREAQTIIVGGGDSAMEEATFLTRFARSVTVIHRRDSLRASKIMQDRAFANPKVTFAWDSEVAEILGEDRVSGVRIRNVKTGEESTIAVTGIFVAIGHDPRSELFTGQLPTDPEGYLIVDQPSTRTVIDGVFAAGDVVDHTYRQAVTAAGTGCAAALDAERWLADHES
jgi:thioredoxin reductase (NADPH)